MSDALLRAACARARGALHTLNVSGCKALTHGALRAVLRAHAATLRRVVAYDLPYLCTFKVVIERKSATDHLKELLTAAPRLEALECDARVGDCTYVQTRLGLEVTSYHFTLLRGAPPFGPLRVRRLVMNVLNADFC